MHIVVLDGHTLNPGDLSWDALHALGPAQIFPRTSPAEVLARAAHAEILLTNKVVLSAETLSALPKLRYVGVLATGYNVVDATAARARGIPVTNVPDYSTESVAQLTFALLLELTHGVGRHSEAVQSGRWTASPDFSFWDQPLIELHGQTFGVVGYGRIGRAVARIASAFGLRVLVHSRTRPHDFPADFEFVSVDDLFARSDIISLHCPLTPETRHLVNADRLRRTKPTACLLNTSRGPLIEEAALADALNSGRLAAAALDVLSVEPPPANNPLLTARNCLITPHLAWASTAARRRLLRIAVDNIRTFLAGKPTNVVN